MKKFSFTIFTALALTACAPTDYQDVSRGDTSASALVSEQKVIPMHQSGYLLLTAPHTWSLKQNNDGPIINLSFDTWKSCIREPSKELCAPDLFEEGMQLDIGGIGNPEGEWPTMDVKNVRIIGTSRTIHRLGEFRHNSDGTWNATEQDGPTKKVTHVLVGKDTVCTVHDYEDVDASCTPTRLQGRWGSVVGELREGEKILRATWIDMP